MPVSFLCWTIDTTTPPMTSKMEASSPRCVQQIHLPSMHQSCSSPPKSTSLNPAHCSNRASAPPISSHPNPTTTTLSTGIVSSSHALDSSHLPSRMPSSPKSASQTATVATNFMTSIGIKTPTLPSSNHHHLHSLPFGHATSWIRALLTTKFYGLCPKHPNLRKNDLNLFCTQHSVKICQYCCHPMNNTSSACNGDSTSFNSDTDCHSKCTVLHVSRYMYHDVLLAREASLLLDLAHVQSYLNNGNRVVYIDRRAQPRSKLAPNAKACAVCDRTLQEPYKFCSIFCRLAFDKHPAAVASLPLPDGTPLPCSNLRKVNTAYSSDAASSKCDRLHERKRGREAKQDGRAKGSSGANVYHIDQGNDDHGNDDTPVNAPIGTAKNEQVTRSWEVDTDKIDKHEKRDSESVLVDSVIGERGDACEVRVTKRCRKRRPIPSLVQVENGLIMSLGRASWPGRPVVRRFGGARNWTIERERGREGERDIQYVAT